MSGHVSSGSSGGGIDRRNSLAVGGEMLVVSEELRSLLSRDLKTVRMDKAEVRAHGGGVGTR